MTLSMVSLRASLLAAGLSFLASTSSVTAAELTGDQVPTSAGPVTIHPISHATMALGWNGLTIYVDPVGGAEAFAGLPAADLILVTDIHGDHFNDDTLAAVTGSTTKIVAPAAVAEKMSPAVRAATTVIANGATTSLMNVGIEAIPMYNLTADRLQYHEKGRGNGYVLSFGNLRFYIAGDTEAVPEMRNLKSIEVAFIPMNLPYTMTEEQAAEGVLAFKPHIVYPYHYRGSDVDKFKALVNAGSADIEVRSGKWY
ncbi:MAG: MBL fold metallo-hydrolase [Gammaproteobacteria bacterium]|nr:MBL fold metallo-hydrolase [Gammaproteobacteria bacterium]